MAVWFHKPVIAGYCFLALPHCMTTTNSGQHVALLMRPNFGFGGANAFFCPL